MPLSTLRIGQDVLLAGPVDACAAMRVAPDGFFLSESTKAVGSAPEEKLAAGRKPRRLD